MAVKHMSIVVPGEILVRGPDWKAGEGTYKQGNAVIAAILGVAQIDFRTRTVRVIPLRAHEYIPKVGDIVIGKVIDCRATHWLVDIGAPWPGRLEAVDFLGRPVDPIREQLRSYLDIGDVVCAKVVMAEPGIYPQLSCTASDLGKLVGGKLIYVDQSKVPRIIGKEGRMISMIKELTRADVRVGANGVVWIRAPNPRILEIVEKAVRMIERESTAPDLYQRVRSLILSEMRKARQVVRR